MAAWRLRRLHHIEAGVFVIRTRDFSGWIERHPDLDPASCNSFVLLNDARDHEVFVTFFVTFSRYEAHLQRMIRMSLQDLKLLRAGRQSQITNQTQSAPKRPNRPRPRKTPS